MRPAAHPNEQNRDWAKTALRLVAFTSLYNLGEGIVSVWVGLAADSISLIGFGGDSFIECAAAAAVLWRMAMETRGAERGRIEAAERAVRRFVGATFLALALYVAAQAGWTLWAEAHPQESLIGIVIAYLSLAIMPPVAIRKLRAARALGSAALGAEAKETLACSYLSLVLLLGLGANAALGWWWADPVAALLMVPWLVSEGIEGLRAENAGR
jgi:divalent metal cation (Fe/Co/Zn/Cd) transporter